MEEMEKEREAAASMVGGKVIDGARTIINYAISRLPFLVVAEDGRVVRPDILQHIQLTQRQRYLETFEEIDRWTALFQAGKITKQQLEQNRQRLQVPEVTKFDIADSLEHFTASRVFGFADLDAALNSLPRHLKILVGIGLAAAKTVLKVNSGAYEQLKTYRRNLVLQMINHSSTQEAYMILKDRPYLLNFVSEYLLFKLGIPAAPRGFIPPPVEIAPSPPKTTVKEGDV